MGRVEKRGKTMLKTIQLDADVVNGVRQLAAQSGKPMRWHVERAISAALEITLPSYRLPKLGRIAAGVVGGATPSKFSLPDLVETMFRRCDQLGIPRPHAQTARKHLRAAATFMPELAVKVTARTSRPFSEEEDRLIAQERGRGRSLSAIGKLTNRRANVILRRLRWLKADQ